MTFLLEPLRKVRKMKTYDWLDEKNEIENRINEIQDMCLIRNMTLKEIKQEVLQATDRILLHLDNIDFAIDEIESDYEDEIDELEAQNDDLLEQIEELKGGK